MPKLRSIATVYRILNKLGEKGFYAMTPDEKWELVRDYYEHAYKVRFNERLSDKVVETLYTEMQKLAKSVEAVYQNGRPSLLKIMASSTKKSPEREQ